MVLGDPEAVVFMKILSGSQSGNGEEGQEVGIEESKKRGEKI